MHFLSIEHCSEAVKHLKGECTNQLLVINIVVRNEVTLTAASPRFEKSYRPSYGK